MGKAQNWHHNHNNPSLSTAEPRHHWRGDVGTKTPVRHNLPDELDEIHVHGVTT